MTDSLFTHACLQELGRYKTLWVGFSGGLDSTVLLHGLIQQPTLKVKVRAVHIHHGLSVNADRWQSHCQQWCQAMDVSLVARSVVLSGNGNVEETARIARYEVFSSLIAEHDCLLVAHHADDQAETLLLQLFRGAGIDGLGAMLPTQPFSQGFLARPLLQQTRQTLEAYAAAHHLHWIEDESNANTSFSRNYLRHELMPLIKKRWPNAVGNLRRSAVHCQQGKMNLEALANIDCEELATSKDRLLVGPYFLSLDYSRQVNIIRTWLKYNHIRLPSTQILDRLIQDVIFAQTDAMPFVKWGKVIVRRYQKTLYLLQEEVRLSLSCLEWLHFPSPLFLSSQGDFLEALPAGEGLRVPEGSFVQVRFRQGGEQLVWRGQTKQLKKLWQEWGVPPWRRDSTPLLYINHELAAIVGYAVGDRYYHQGDHAYHIHRRFELAPLL